jgi:LysM repeat protein
MSCREARHLLSYRREWTPAEGAAAEAHLAACLACQAVAREYELMDRRLGRLSAPVLEARLPAMIGRRWGAREAETRANVPISAGPAAALLALLAAVLVVAAVWPSPRQKMVGELPAAARLMPQGPGVGGGEEPAATLPASPLRSTIITYTMGITENVESVARRFGLAPETVLLANLPDHDSLGRSSLPTELIILPIDGALYIVQPGDTLEKVALRHRVHEEAITGFALNGLEEPYELRPGQQLIVPGATRFYTKGVVYQSSALSRQGYPYPLDAPKGSGTFAWPTEGYLMQGYWSEHQAIDIANETGTPVVAADHGYVILAGKDVSVYGNQVLIGHGNGYTTRYAHLDTMLVYTGDVVSKGQQIGTMGSAGNARAPHLHFEISEEGLRRNPLGYLP